MHPVSGLQAPRQLLRSRSRTHQLLLRAAPVLRTALGSSRRAEAPSQGSLAAHIRCSCAANISMQVHLQHAARSLLLSNGWSAAVGRQRQPRTTLAQHLEAALVSQQGGAWPQGHSCAAQPCWCPSQHAVVHTCCSDHLGMPCEPAELSATVGCHAVCCCSMCRRHPNSWSSRFCWFVAGPVCASSVLTVQEDVD
jgi:hypothetical protein